MANDIRINVSDNSANISIGTSNKNAHISIGTASIVAIPYTGAYTVTPKAYQEQVLPTAGCKLSQDVTVFQVPYFETANLFDGNTVYIASEV